VYECEPLVNGIDMDEWNPAADEHCAAPFDVTDFSGKLEVKRALQKELGFEVRDDVPLMVGRCSLTLSNPS
jgi:starch synthase